jgi:diguanylate cyclase (GGDEF)-like protein
MLFSSFINYGFKDMMKDSITSQLKILREYLSREEKTLKSQDKEILKKDAEISRLKALVTKDELTGVLNRRGFCEELDRIYSDIHYAQENEEIKRHFFVDMLSILYIDVDNFKKANDLYGHKMGDKILKKITILLEDEIRRIDFIGRLGGDEFAVALIGTSLEDAFDIAEKIRKAVAEKVNLPKKKGVRRIPKITISIGVASSKNSKNPKRLIDRADSAMYESKHEFDGNKVTKYLN